MAVLQYSSKAILYIAFTLCLADIAYTKYKQTVVCVIVINVLRYIDRWCNGPVFNTTD